MNPRTRKPLPTVKPWLELLETRELLSVTVGAMGDSYTDETGPVAGIPNWVEILEASSRADFGILRGNYASGDPRRGSGMSYENNFALGGARASDFAGCGNNQQTGCSVGGPARFRASAVSRVFDYGVLEIGGNDFIQGGIFQGNFLVLPYPLYPQGATLFNNTRSSYVNGLNLATANGSAPVRMLLATLPDLGTFPFAAALPPQQRDNLRTWIIAWNVEITVLAAQRGYGVMDFWGLWEQFRQSGGTTVHGIRINPGAWDGQGGAQGMRTFFLNDGLHATPIGHAFMVNQFVADMNARYGTNLTPLTPKEMVTFSLLDPQRDPIANTGGPYIINVGDSLTVRALGSTDPNPGDIPYLQYYWDLNSDWSFDDALGYEQTLSWPQLEALGVQAGVAYFVTVFVDDTFGGWSVAYSWLWVNDPNAPRPGLDGLVVAALEGTVGRKKGSP